MTTEKERVRKKAYYKANKKHILARSKLYYEENIEKVKIRHSLYQKAHREAARLRSKKSAIKHPETRKIWYRAHAEEKSEYGKYYRKSHPEIDKIHGRKRRAAKHNVGHEPYATKSVFERDKWTCGICGLFIDRTLKHPHPLSSSIDHVKPLSKGGDDHLVNVQAAHLICNIRKNAKGATAAAVMAVVKNTRFI